MRAQRPFTPGHLERLERDGVHVRSVAGDVLSADLSAKDLERLADQDFVTAIELLGSVFAESSGEPGGSADVE